MKCDKCSNETQCHTVPIYYAQVLGRESSKHDEVVKITTTTVTRYSEISKRDYKICNDCIVASEKKSSKLRPLYSFLVLAALGVLSQLLEEMKIIPSGTTNIVLYILCGIWVLFIVSSIIGLAKKSRNREDICDPKDY